MALWLFGEVGEMNWLTPRTAPAGPWQNCHQSLGYAMNQPQQLSIPRLRHLVLKWPGQWKTSEGYALKTWRFKVPLLIWYLILEESAASAPYRGVLSAAFCCCQTTCIFSLILLKIATLISLTSRIISRCVQAGIGDKLLDYQLSTAWIESGFIKWSNECWTLDRVMKVAVTRKGRIWLSCQTTAVKRPLSSAIAANRQVYVSIRHWRGHLWVKKEGYVFSF